MLIAISTFSSEPCFRLFHSILAVTLKIYKWRLSLRLRKEVSFSLLEVELGQLGCRRHRGKEVSGSREWNVLHHISFRSRGQWRPAGYVKCPLVLPVHLRYFKPWCSLIPENFHPLSSLSDHNQDPVDWKQKLSPNSKCKQNTRRGKKTTMCKSPRIENTASAICCQRV